MRQLPERPSWALAILAAIFTPPFAFGLLYWELVAGLYGNVNSNGNVTLLLMFIAAVLVSICHVLLLGLPLVFLLRRQKWLRWWTVTASGFVLGAIPMAFFSWPRYAPGSGASDSRGILVVDGVPTAAWWQGYFTGVASMAAIGALTGLVFWLVWMRSNRRE
jgi:hypothetical protein